MVSNTPPDLSPFLKSLVSSDRPTRDAALSSLQTYISAPFQTFTPLDLLKIWKSLFYCVFHTDRPLPQQRLCRSLTSLLPTLPEDTFLGFLRAFWITMAGQWSAIPGLRLDKYLLLCRCYVQGAFQCLATKGWEAGLVEGYLRVVEEVPLSTGLEAADGNMGGKVPDGLRYHVLDVWVDGLEGQEEGMPQAMLERVVGTVQRLAMEGKTKVLREKAKEALRDERLSQWTGGFSAAGDGAEVLHDECDHHETCDEEWGGFGD